MRLPGYVAEAAVGRSVHGYRGTSSSGAVGSGQLVFPSLFSWTNVVGSPYKFIKFGRPGETIAELLGELGVGGRSCLLDCGESRADCYRTCRKSDAECQDICDTADQMCGMNCFFNSGVNLA